ncbi:MAG TPA: hypothetical protein VNA25_14020 [Phycisphaerae bacterium]|nr:hypothetical protein [Phycisphaerae bacterium]
MTTSRNEDEQLLIDFLLGRCDPSQAEAVAARLQKDQGFRQLRDDIQNTLAAMRLLPEVEPPEDLAARTLRKVESVRKADAYVTTQETTRPWAASTFSLREVAAVAAAVVLLGVVFLPSLRKAHQRSLRGQCASNMGQIGTAVSSYASENHEYLPIATDRPYRWLPGDGKTVSNSAAMFKLIRHAQASPVVFQCPATGRASFAVHEGMVDFPAGEFISYSYQHSLSPAGPLRRDRLSPDEQQKMAILADNSPVFEDGRFRRDRVGAAASDNHGGDGQNVLYLDCSVSWAEGPAVGVGGNNIFLVDGVFDYRGDEQPASRTDTFLLPNYSPKR